MDLVISSRVCLYSELDWGSRFDMVRSVFDMYDHYVYACTYMPMTNYECNLRFANKNRCKLICNIKLRLILKCKWISNQYLKCKGILQTSSDSVQNIEGYLQ